MIIETLQPRDAIQLNKLLVSNTERFIRYLPKTLSANRTLESTHGYIRHKIEAAENHIEMVYTIKDKYGIQIIGLVILKHLNWEQRRGEFAYCIGKGHKGKGLMSEAIKAVSQYAMAHLGLRTLQIISHKTNLASVNVAKNADFIWKETLPNEFTPTNEAPLDMELYELEHEG